MHKLWDLCISKLWLNLLEREDFNLLVQVPASELTEDQMLDLIMWIDTAFDKYSLTNGFQDNPRDFFMYLDQLGKSPYQLLQDDPWWWIVILSSMYNLNHMVFD